MTALVVAAEMGLIQLATHRTVDITVDLFRGPQTIQATYVSDEAHEHSTRLRPGKRAKWGDHDIVLKTSTGEKVEITLTDVEWERYGKRIKALDNGPFTYYPHMRIYVPDE
ncbi:MAG: hypothetical protein Q4P66_04485 [Actinomycetaceae bacterium]|nr:hypothetical protein [Actinomycetaceae bacterium]